MSRIKDMNIGDEIRCSRHGGLVALTESMRKDQRRICDACIAAYKKTYLDEAQKAIRSKKESSGEWFDTSSLPGEQWLDVPGYSGYQASTLGRIRSIDRRVVNGRIAYGRILSQHRNCLGYCTVRARAGDSQKCMTKSVHSLIALTFIGPRPDGLEIAHLDGNPSNNRLENLRYATHSENEADKARHGTRFIASGVRNGHAKLSEGDVLDIRREVALGVTKSELARRYRISWVAIHNIATGRNWRHVR